MRSNSPRLLFRFALYSGLAIAFIGSVLILEMRSTIRGQALDEARQLAGLATSLRVKPELRDVDLSEPLSPPEVARLNTLVTDQLREADILRIQVWNRRGDVVYSNDRSLQGERFAVEGDLAAALDGFTIAGIQKGSEAETIADERLGDLIEVYVPLRFGGGPIVGAFEVYISYETVAASSEKKLQRTLWILLSGLVLLWAALFRLMAGASSRLRRQAEENRKLAREDGLTGLANRTSFTELASEALARRPAKAAVLLLDLDRFKDLNDSLGHHAGDLLLREIGPRLQSALPEGAVVARLGGDEFVALLSPVEADEAMRAAERVRECLNRPVEIEGIAVSAEGSVGIAHYPVDGADVATLLQRADVAMYEAKEHRLGVANYRPDADRSSHERLLILADLREAIERDELVLHYQPKVSLLDNNRVVGAEALVRWNHPERGLVPPFQFVPLAEHTGLIRPLTAWVIERALRDTRGWWDRGHRITVAVNLSVANLVDPTLPGLVARLLAETRLPPSVLEFEITESVLMTEPERALRTLTLLRSMGAKLAVDDYGTGHSSLAYLHQLPLNTLKIDRSFVSTMAAEGGVIVRSTVDLAHSLGLNVVAEGIEDLSTALALRALGCDLGQGFHYARPVPIEEMLSRLEPPPFMATILGSAAAEVGEHRKHAPVIDVGGSEVELVEDA